MGISTTYLKSQICIFHVGFKCQIPIFSYNMRGLKQCSRDCDEAQHSAFRTEVSRERISGSCCARISGPVQGVWDLYPCPACPPLPAFPVPVEAGALGRALLGAGVLASMAGNELLLSHISAHPGLDTGVACWWNIPGDRSGSQHQLLSAGVVCGEGLNWDLSGVKIPDGCAPLAQHRILQEWEWGRHSSCSPCSCDSSWSWQRGSGLCSPSH